MIEKLLRNWVAAAERGHKRNADVGFGVQDEGRCCVSLYDTLDSGTTSAGWGFDEDTGRAFELAIEDMAANVARRERAALESASSVECAAHDSERAQ